MTFHRCGQLDDFLDGSLAAEERAAFGHHLEECGACRRALQERERVQQLLRRAVAALETVPEGMAARVRSRIQQNSRRRWVRRALSIAAAVVLVGVILWWFFHPLPPQIAEKKLPTPSTPPAPATQAYVEFRTPGITVPVRTKSPHVTIVWVYPSAE